MYISMREGIGQRLLTATNKIWKVGKDEHVCIATTVCVEYIIHQSAIDFLKL